MPVTSRSRKVIRASEPISRIGIVDTSIVY
jgi:hypothetical protein